MGGGTRFILHTHTPKRLSQGMASTNEESRQWVSIFRSLWSAAPKLAEVVDQQQRHPSRARCHLHLLVPDTILFQRGEPCKWVGSSPQGIVVRKPFLQASSDEPISSNAAGAGEAPSEIRHPNLASRLAAKRRASSSSSRVMDDFEVLERLGTVIAVFSAFATSGLSSPPSSDVESGVPLCVARYNDGTSELLSSKSLKTLCKFFNWRASLCALQAYVQPRSAQGSTPTAMKTIGTYNRKRERREKNTHHRHSQHSNANRDRSRAASGHAAASRSGIDHVEDEKARIGGKPSLPISSSTTAAISDLQPSESPLAVAADDDSSSSTSLQSLTTALNQATEDVAFATDMSYSWPVEPSRATPRRGHGNATSASCNVPPADISSLGKQDIATNGDRNQADNRTALVVGGSPGQLQRCRPPWPKSRVRVSHLEAEFVIDRAGRVWFTNALKVCFAT